MCETWSISCDLGMQNAKLVQQNCFKVILLILYLQLFPYTYSYYYRNCYQLISL